MESKRLAKYSKGDFVIVLPNKAGIPEGVLGVVKDVDSGVNGFMYFVAYEDEEVKSRNECEGHYWSYERDIVPVGWFTGTLYGS